VILRLATTFARKLAADTAYPSSRRSNKSILGNPTYEMLHATCL